MAIAHGTFGDYDEIAAPAAPAAGKVRVYSKTGTGRLFSKNSAGVETTLAALSLRLAAQFADVGNVGAGEDDLHSYSMPGGTLATDGDAIRYVAAYEAAGAPGGTTQTVRVKFGATTLVTRIVAAGTKEVMEAVIWRTGAATQRWVVYRVSSNGTVASDYGTAAETLSGAVVLKSTGESAGGTPANNDIVQHLSLVESVFA